MSTRNRSSHASQPRHPAQPGPLARLALSLLPALILFSSGCGYVRVTLTADGNTNSGRPLQVLVRSVDEQTYRQDSYAAVSQQVIHPDQSVLRKLVIEPRHRQKKSFCVKPGKGRGLALYVLRGGATYLSALLSLG